MYKRHWVSVCICFLLVFAGSFFLKLNFGDISEVAITVVSIVLAVYIAASSGLLGNPYASEMKKQRDSQLPTKSALGVLATYLRWAGSFSTATITISCIFLFNVEIIHNNLVYQLISSASCGLFAVNIVFMWLVFTFLVNTLTKATK